MSSKAPELPGMYYDEARRKYFKILPHHVAPHEAPYSEQNIRKKHRQEKRAKHNYETRNSGPAERPVQRLYEKKLPWRLLERESQTNRSQRMASELPATAYASGLKCKVLLQISKASDSSLVEIGPFAYNPDSREWCVVNSPTGSDPWFLTRVESPSSQLIHDNPNTISNEEYPSKLLIWENKLILLERRYLHLGTLNAIACPLNKTSLLYRSRLYGAGSDRETLTLILGQVFTRYHLRRTIPALAEPEDPVTCVSSPQARSRKPFETGDPSILAVGYGKKIELLSSDPLCEMEFYRRFLYHYPRDPDHGVAEKSSLRVDSNVLSLECFPDSWLLAYGLRNGDIGIHDYRLPPDARLGWLRHPSSVTGLRKLRGNEIIACGPQHALFKYDLRFSHIPHRNKVTTPILAYDHQNEYQIDLGFDVDDDCGIVAAATDQKSVRLFSLDTGARLESPASTYEYQSLVRQISFEPDLDDGSPRRLVLSHMNQILGFSYGV